MCLYVSFSGVCGDGAAESEMRHVHREEPLHKRPQRRPLRVEHGGWWIHTSVSFLCPHLLSFPVCAEGVDVG